MLFGMKLSPQIKDAFKASTYIIGIVALIAVSISIYDAVHFSESKQIQGFVSFASILHDDLDLDEVSNDYFNLVDTISNDKIDDPSEMNFLLVRGSSVVRHYKESFYLLLPPTDSMLELRESLIQEASSFLAAYYYLREAWESRIEGYSEEYLANMQKAEQSYEDAVSLRTQNESTLDYWWGIIED